MGREHEPSPTARDLALEPFDGRDVEVVRRLVEEQEVRLPDHGPGQHDASLLSARQRLERGFGFDAGLLQGAFDPPVAVPALGRGPVVKSRGHDVPDRAGEGAGKHLGDKGDRESRRPLEVPGVRLAVAGENREEGGLPRAVAPREADPVAGRKLQLHVREQDVGADVGNDVPGPQQAHAVQGYRYPPRHCAPNDAWSPVSREHFTPPSRGRCRLSPLSGGRGPPASRRREMILIGLRMPVARDEWAENDSPDRSRPSSARPRQALCIEPAARWRNPFSEAGRARPAAHRRRPRRSRECVPAAPTPSPRGR